MLISENIHIISKQTKSAILNKDDAFILNIVKNSLNAGVCVCDLNIGPAKGDLKGSMKYLTELIQSECEVDFSFDTSNIDEMDSGFFAAKNPSKCFLNSVSYDLSNIEKKLEIACKHNSNIIALSFNPSKGISKDSNERLELLFNLIEKTTEFGIDNSKIYADPLVLPISVAQESAVTVLDSIRMFKESFSPSINTIVGLSNISNGSPAEIRPLLNKVFLALAMGSGLDSAIVDSNDSELVRLYNLLENIENPSVKNINSVDNLYISLYKIQSEFAQIDDIEYDKTSNEQKNIINAAKLLLNSEIYSHSFYYR